MKHAKHKKHQEALAIWTGKLHAKNTATDEVIMEMAKEINQTAYGSCMLHIEQWIVTPLKQHCGLSQHLKQEKTAKINAEVVEVGFKNHQYI